MNAEELLEARLAGMEEAARWLETMAAYSGSNRCEMYRDAARDIRVRAEIIGEAGLY